MAGAGEITKDIWHLEKRTLTQRNNVRLRRWGMPVTVTNDPTPGNNTTWILVYNLVDTDKSNNSNWQKIADYVSSSPSSANVSILTTDLTQLGNVGVAETTIFSFTLPADTLNTNNQSIRGICAGVLAAAATNKRLKVKLNGSEIFDSGDFVDFDGNDFVLEFQIIRESANAQKCLAKIATVISTINASFAALTEDLTTDLDIEVTAQGTNNDEIVMEMTKILFEPI